MLLLQLKQTQLPSLTFRIQKLLTTLVCHLETNIECVEPLHVHHITEEDLKLLQQGGFIWLSYIPRGSFQELLNQCSQIEASVAIDFPGLVQKSGFHLLYKHDEVEFKETIRQCMALFSNEHEVVPKVIDQSETNETKTQLGKSDLLVIHKLLVFALLHTLLFHLPFLFLFSHIRQYFLIIHRTLINVVSINLVFLYVKFRSGLATKVMRPR